MSNANTIAGYLSGSAVNQLPLLSLTSTASTTATYIPVTTNAGTSAAIIRVPQQADIMGSTRPLASGINQAGPGAYGTINPAPQYGGDAGFNTGSFDGRPFRVRMPVSYTVSASATTSALTIVLAQGTTTSATTAIASPTAITLATGGGSGVFVMDAEILWDSVSHILGGRYSFYYTFGTAATNVASSTISTTTGVTTPAGLSFLLSVVAQTALVGGITLQANEFVIEVV